MKSGSWTKLLRSVELTALVGFCDHLFYDSDRYRLSGTVYTYINQNWQKTHLGEELSEFV